MTNAATVASPVDFEVHGDYGIKASTGAGGAFSRPAYAFRGRITADGSSGHPAEPGRYHLYVSLACPWAHRSVIVRALKGLEDVVSLSVVDPVRDGRGWAFREGPGHTPDPVNGFALLREAYEASDPGYDAHVSVPVLWDRETGRIVSNNFPDITIDLGTQFERWANTDVDLYPVDLRPEIDALNDLVYTTVNNGVYRCGFAKSQEAYDEAVVALFATLDDLEARLGTGRYLFGDRLTEADVRLWVTLVRFDTVYATHFKANVRRVADHPNLWAYTRDLFQRPAFGGTTNFDHIKRHYYTTHPQINPTRIVPAGPVLDWDAPHGRENPSS
ncbi:glutathione-dependent reductase [Sphaerisporangium siamense]|uniref:Putative glutathione S-transferase n=1 Tax=Sphaerisporangium siamense TaxID=795645 RepID=A0A7W7D4V4_9ACTN|nr:glutathione S-transferase family protein [Sphaerisporangium siamense]MBB4700349.1 putative glutathione S-transferase [Sphaerisporangium siamense]GII87765.1 glutathione-dependent reductase [Sphaerisporangium siamense]